MKDFRVGEEIRVRQWDDMEQEFGLNKKGNINCSPSFEQFMRHLCGKKARIYLILGHEIKLNRFEDSVNNDPAPFYFSRDMIEHIEEEEKMTSNAVTNALMDVLGVEVGEEFNVPTSVYNPFHFREDGQLIDCDGSIRADLFGDIATGIRNIQKIPVKEMTVAEIEKNLGYKIKIIADKEEKDDE